MKLPTSEFYVDNGRETFPSVLETSDNTIHTTATAVLTEYSQNNAYNPFIHEEEIY